MAYNSSHTGKQIDSAVGAVIEKEKTWDGKQDALTGKSGQVVGFDADGKPKATDAPSGGMTEAAADAKYLPLAGGEMTDDATIVFGTGKRNDLSGSSNDSPSLQLITQDTNRPFGSGMQVVHQVEDEGGNISVNSLTIHGHSPMGKIQGDNGLEATFYDDHTKKTVGAYVGVEGATAAVRIGAINRPTDNDDAGVHITDVVTPTDDADAANKKYVDAQTANKQDKLIGTKGQIVGFDADGNAAAQDDKAVMLGQKGVAIAMPSSAAWSSVCYGGGKFVAVAGSVAAWSEDGLTWTQVAMPDGISVGRICYGDGKFVAVGGADAVYSKDGIEWTKITLPIEVSAHCYADNKFLAVGYRSAGLSSDDGINWTQVDFSERIYPRDICHGDGKFVVVESDVTGEARIMYSEDAVNWTAGTDAIHIAQFSAVCYGNGIFVAVSARSLVLYSTDGATWTQATLPISVAGTSVCYGNGKFIITSYGSRFALCSTDGITWTQVAMPKSAEWKSSCYGDDKFVALAEVNGAFAYSADGVTWSDTVPVDAIVDAAGEDVAEQVQTLLGVMTESAADAKYLPLAGGTLTGGITRDGVTLLNGTRSGKDNYNNTFRLVTVGDDDFVLIGNGNVMLPNIDLVCGALECNAFFTEGEGIYLKDSPDTEQPPLVVQVLQDGDDNYVITVRNTITTKMEALAYKSDFLACRTIAHKVTLTASGWNSSTKQQTVNCADVVADETAQQIIPMPAAANMTAYNDAGIQCTGQAAGKLTFTAETVPTAAIDVYVTITPVSFS